MRERPRPPARQQPSPVGEERPESGEDGADENSLAASDPGEPPQSEGPCPECGRDGIEANGPIRTPFGDMVHLACAHCDFEAAAPY